MAAFKQSKRILLACGVLLFQTKLMPSYTFYQTTEPFQGEVKYEVMQNSFNECAKQCLYDLDCIYVSYVENSETSEGVICSIYMSSTNTTVVDDKLFRINRAESNLTCGNVVRGAAAQQYKKIAAPESLLIEEIQCPQYLPTFTVYVYVSEKGFHAYSTSGTSPMLGYSKNCSMNFVGELEACRSIPVFTRGDYLRFYFGAEYNKTGYNYMSMTVFPQYCYYNSSPTTCWVTNNKYIREYKNKDYYDFVYLDKPPPGYIETDVSDTLWPWKTDCY